LGSVSVDYSPVCRVRLGGLIVFEEAEKPSAALVVDAAQVA
jgi:hypothetical protein